MEQINVKYFYDLGRVIEALHNTVSSPGKNLTPSDWSNISNAATWLESLKTYNLVPRTSIVAEEIAFTLSAIMSAEKSVSLSDELCLNMSALIMKFTHVLESETPELYTNVVRPVGAYSVEKLMNDATSHLSRLAQSVISDKQKEDFNKAGMCLAFDLYTACGFHAMRALEEEARVYHRVVTGVELNDSPIGAIINGDSRVTNSGLKTQFAKEGSKNDSPLGLIISTLTHVNKIYRVRITHPDMTLNYDQAKHVFDLAATALSALAEDGRDRFVKAQKAKAPVQTGPTP